MNCDDCGHMRKRTSYIHTGRISGSSIETSCEHPNAQGDIDVHEYVVEVRLAHYDDHHDIPHCKKPTAPGWCPLTKIEEIGPEVPPPDRPFKLIVEYDSITLKFSDIVNHDPKDYHHGDVPLAPLTTIDLTETTVLLAGWARWIDALCQEEARSVEIMTEDMRHHREAFESLGLDRLLSRMT